MAIQLNVDKETVMRVEIGLTFGPVIRILHNGNAPDHKALSVKKFLAQKSITELEHLLCFPHLAPNYLWLFPKIKSSLKRRRFQDAEDIKESVTDGTLKFSTPGVPKTFPTVVSSLG